MTVAAFDVSQWIDMMADVVTIDPWVSSNVSGVPTYAGVPVSYTCYIEMKNHLIVDAHGREIMARGKVFMATTTIPSVKDKLTLPVELVPVNAPILAVDAANDETGTHHVVLEIGF